MAAHVEHETVEARRVQELDVGQGSVARRFPAVDEHDSGARPAIAGRHEPCRQRRLPGLDDRFLERQAEVGRRVAGRAPAGLAGPRAVDQREPVGKRERSDRNGRRDPGSTGRWHVVRGRPDGRHVKRAAAGRGPGRSAVPSRRNPSIQCPRGQTKPARCPWRRPRGERRDDQGGLAAARAGPPSRSHGRRCPGRARGDTPDGRDQCGV